MIKVSRENIKNVKGRGQWTALGENLFFRVKWKKCCPRSRLDGLEITGEEKL